MRAVQVSRLDGPPGVAVAELEAPRPGPGEVAVEVHAAGVSFPDMLLSKGLYQNRPGLPFTLGGEIAGIIREAGPGTGWHPGQRIAAYCGTGGLAEVAVVSSDAVFALPDAVPCGVGAALSMNTFTVHFALLRRGRLQPGENVVVHGAGGAVGSAAVQVAAAFGGRVLAVASTEEKRRAALRSGAVAASDVEKFPEAAREFAGYAGVDIVLDPVGGPRFVDSLRILGPEGRLLVVGFAGGSIPEVRVNRLLLNNIAVVGVGWGAFSQLRPGYVREQWDELAPLVVAGRIRPSLGEYRDLYDVQAVLAAIEARRSVGQTIVAVRRCACSTTGERNRAPQE